MQFVDSLAIESDRVFDRQLTKTIHDNAIEQMNARVLVSSVAISNNWNPGVDWEYQRGWYAPVRPDATRIEQRLRVRGDNGSTYGVQLRSGHRVLAETEFVGTGSIQTVTSWSPYYARSRATVQPLEVWARSAAPDTLADPAVVGDAVSIAGNSVVLLEDGISFIGRSYNTAELERGGYWVVATLDGTELFRRRISYAPEAHRAQWDEPLDRTQVRNKNPLTTLTIEQSGPLEVWSYSVATYSDRAASPVWYTPGATESGAALWHGLSAAKSKVRAMFLGQQWYSDPRPQQPTDVLLYTTRAYLPPHMDRVWAHIDYQADGDLFLRHSLRVDGDEGAVLTDSSLVSADIPTASKGTEAIIQFRVQSPYAYTLHGITLWAESER